MMEVWSHGSDASAMHPFGGRSLGWEEVRAGWEQAAQAFSGGQVTLDEMVVFAISEDAAYTLGTEHGQGKVGEQTLRIDWRGANNYPRGGEGWEKGPPPTHFSSGGGP